MYGSQHALLGGMGKGILFASALLVAAVSFAQPREDPTTVRLGVLAKRGSGRCLEKWGPTAEHLTATIPGYSFVIRPLSYGEVYTAVKQEEVDFILANPSLYVELESSLGASRIVTLKNLRPNGTQTTVFGGVIFRKADNRDIEHPEDLKGKTFMAVEETSFGGWQMAWRELKEQGIDPYRHFADLRFGGTHDAVVYAVRRGTVDAGTVRSDTLERMEMEGKIRLEQFRVIGEHRGDEDLPFLHSTRTYPEWPLAKVAHTSDDLAEKVAAALVTTSADTPAAKAARCAGWTIPHNYQPVHECLKELRLGPYRDYGKVTPTAVVRQYWPWLAAAAAFLILVAVVAVYVARLNRKLRLALSEYGKELTERKRTEQALRESERLVAETETLAATGRLAARVAHEINNPLAGIKSAFQLVKKAVPKDYPRYDYVDQIEKEINRIAMIVRQMIGLHRAERETESEISVRQVLQHVASMLEPTRRNHGVSVEIEMEECPDFARLPENALRQVLYSLLANGIEASPRDETVSIQAVMEDGMLRIRIRDRGPGIPENLRTRVFEPFFTTKDAGTTGGLGLGLSISKGIVEAAGGTLDFKSQPDQGCVFEIVLPIGETDG